MTTLLHRDRSHECDFIPATKGMCVKEKENSLKDYLRWGFLSSIVGFFVSMIVFFLVGRRSDVLYFAFLGLVLGFAIGVLTILWDRCLQMLFLEHFRKYPLYLRIINLAVPTVVILLSCSFFLQGFRGLESLATGLRVSSLLSLAVAASFGTITVFYDTLGQYIGRKVRSRILGGYLQKGETVHVAVLFLDVRNSTVLGERMSPEDFVSLLNAFFEAAVGVIERNRGVVNKFMGDAILAFWGETFSSKTPCVDAARAALEVSQRIAEMNPDWQQKHLFQVEAGMGIHYGKVIAGNIGSRERREFTIMGDTVNTAKRLEELTKETQTEINVSEGVRRYLGDMFPVVYLGEFQLKGKAEKQAAYALVRPAEQGGPTIL